MFQNSKIKESLVTYLSKIIAMVTVDSISKGSFFRFLYVDLGQNLLVWWLSIWFCDAFKVRLHPNSVRRRKTCLVREG